MPPQISCPNPNCRKPLFSNATPCPNCGEPIIWDVSWTPRLASPSQTRPAISPSSTWRSRRTVAAGAPTKTPNQFTPQTWGGTPTKGAKRYRKHRKWSKRVLAAILGLSWLGNNPWVLNFSFGQLINVHTEVHTAKPSQAINIQIAIFNQQTVYKGIKVEANGVDAGVYDVAILDPNTWWKVENDRRLLLDGSLDVILDWEKIFDPEVRKQILDSDIIICTGVADQDGSNQKDQENLGFRRATNLKKAVTKFKRPGQVIKTLNFGQWKSSECDVRVATDDQRRLILIGVRQPPMQDTHFSAGVIGALEQIAGGDVKYPLLKSNSDLVKSLLACYSLSKNLSIR